MTFRFADRATLNSTADRILSLINGLDVSREEAEQRKLQEAYAKSNEMSIGEGQTEEAARKERERIMQQAVEEQRQRQGLLLENNPVLKDVFATLIDANAVSHSDFWDTFYKDLDLSSSRAITNLKQDKGVSSSFVADLKKEESADGKVSQYRQRLACAARGSALISNDSLYLLCVLLDLDWAELLIV